MSRKTILILVVGIIAVMSVVLVKKRLAPSQPAVVATVESKRILVAKRDVPAGKFIDSAQDLDWVEPRAEDAEADVIREAKTKKSAFNGGITRKALKTGKSIAPDDITKAGDGGFLSAVLEPGMRAVSIAVTATTGAAGFIAPGDRVDLIITHRIKAARGDSSTQDTVVSETFVRDVRVVAVDQSLGQTENKAQLAKNVTVEVSEAQAEQVAVATEMGKISMALRSTINDASTIATTDKGATRDSDISKSLIKQNTVSPRVLVIRGAQKEDVQFFDKEAQ